MDHKVVIIAEAGVNHNADPSLARDMIAVAAEAGADYVKFQTAVPELVISSVAPKASYQKELTGDSESQLEMCRKLHFPVDYYATVKEMCTEAGIGFLSTPFDSVSLRFLLTLGMDFLKVPSGEITNKPFLREVAAGGLPVLLSTGMAEWWEVRRAAQLLLDGGVPSLTVLQCNTQYPTPFEDVNLLAMPRMGRALGVSYGYSDHTSGIEASVAAVALGATVVEKHFTLSRSLPGPDHKASLEPSELRSMVKAIRNVEAALGSPEKTASPSERENIAIARRSLVAARPIKAGEIFTEENLIAKRPGNGISPWDIDSILGTRASRDFDPDELISL